MWGRVKEEVPPGSLGGDEDPLDINAMFAGYELLQQMPFEGSALPVYDGAALSVENNLYVGASKEKAVTGPRSAHEHSVYPGADASLPVEKNVTPGALGAIREQVRYAPESPHKTVCVFNSLLKT